MITFNGYDCWLLPNYSRNMINTYPMSKLVSNSFTIETTVKIDWENIEKEENSHKGIVSFNGMHFGIQVKIVNGEYIVSSEAWTLNDDGVSVLNDCYLVVDKEETKEWTKLKMVYEKDKMISIEVNEQKREMNLGGKLVDYKSSYLWIGCQDNHKTTPEKYRGNFYGQMKELKIYTPKDTFFKSNFKKRTRYKIYDEANNGNHIMKKYLNKENYIIIF